MTTRQLLCAVIAIVCGLALIVEGVAGGSLETLRIFSVTLGAAIVFFVASHIPNTNP